jgi:phosphatidylglycerophosphate synthase
VTPNQVTVLRGLLNALALACFAGGSHRLLVWGFVLFQMFELLDHVDGDLARLKGMSSRMGALMEAFIDAYGARPSNLFGLCVAVGMVSRTGETASLALFCAIALGRLLWLEYRGPFGWGNQRSAVLGSEHGDYRRVLGVGSFRESVQNFLVIAYTWQNQFILWAALLQRVGERALKIDTLFWSMVLVAALNHIPWLALVLQGFWRASREGNRAG